MNWDVLSAEERDTLIAEKVMGWQWIPYDFYDVLSVEHPVWLLQDASDIVHIAPGEWTYCDEDKDGKPTSNRLLIHNFIPRYTTDMNAAWEVVDRVTKPPTTLAAAERAANTRFGFWFDAARLWSYSAKEAADAICKAALIAVGEIE